jgi:hypothetical protein
MEIETVTADIININSNFLVIERHFTVFTSPTPSSKGSILTPEKQHTG